MKIILDIYGGDNAPLAPLKGAEMAVKELGVEIIAVGNEAEMKEICEKEKISITDEEYETAKTELAKEMSYASVEDMVDDVTEEKVRSYIMRDLVKEWLVDHCVQVKQ